MLDVLGLPPKKAAELVTEMGGKPEHARRLLRGVYRARDEGLDLAAKVAAVPNLPKRVREAWLETCRLRLPEVRGRQSSETDPGTIKYLLAGEDGATFETVLFRNRKAAGRWSLCISTQAGCRMACPFCATGKAGLTRNLTAAEMVSQLVLARRDVPAGERIANLVAMGMGEPLDNLEPLLDALSIFHDSDCLSLAADRMVISTCGHVPGLQRLAAFPISVGLAVSLHAANDGLRDRLVPLNRRWNLAQLLATLREYPLRTGKWICFEYILLKGVNDSSKDAAALAPLLSGLRALVQIIPYNAIPGGEFEAPDETEARAFADKVRAGGVPVALRWSRGPDIDAACGQLRASARTSPASTG